MSTPLVPAQIVEYVDAIHRPAIRSAVIALQDFECALDPRLPTGQDIVDDFVPQMLRRCQQSDGKVLVAECEGEVAGFVTVLTKVSSDELHEGNYEYGLISDLIVLEKFRRRGLGRQLLAAAESLARSKKVQFLRIGVLSKNLGANELYAANGFTNLFSELEKNLTETE